MKITLLLLLLTSLGAGTILQAAVLINQKVSNGSALAKGLIKVCVSGAVAIQSIRYLRSHSSDKEIIGTIAVLTIPNVHFFISGCNDIYDALHAMKEKHISVRTSHKLS